MDLDNYFPYDENEEGALRSFRQFYAICGERIFARENLSGHATASAWIVNPTRNRVLMIYHNLYDSWAWVGGHADGDSDLLRVALKETGEETGLSHMRVVSPNPIDINILTVDNHIKRGEYVPRHLHYNFVFLLEADEKEAVKENPAENSGVKWIDFDKVKDYCSEKEIYPYYERIMKKIAERKL